MAISGAKRFFSGLLVIGLTLVSGRFFQIGYSANLTSVSVTISNPRPSFLGALTNENTAGNSVAFFDGTQNSQPSTSSAQLAQGDILWIGSGATAHNYTIASLSSQTSVSLTSALAAGDADTGDVVMSSQSASLTVKLTTVSALSNGRFRILVPAVSDNNLAADGIVDQGKFDFSTTTPTVTCPTDLTGYDFVAGTATASTITLNGQDYHSFECAYSGAGATGTVFNAVTNDAFVISGLINPAPVAGHTSGTADTFGIVVQQIDSNFNVIDQTSTKIGLIEAVRVTATVSPQITFRIIGVNSGTSICGISTNVTTTPTSVPFGDVPIDSFTNAAQALSVSTNAAGGYTVTAIENDQLGKNGGVCTGDPTTNANCIRDSVGDDDSMTHTVTADWTSTAKKGFAYTLHDSNNTTTEDFSYTSCAGTYCARQFADAENTQAAQRIFYDTTTADNDNLYVCYKIIPDITTAAGFYENYITYTATSTF